MDSAKNPKPRVAKRGHGVKAASLGNIPKFASRVEIIEDFKIDRGARFRWWLSLRQREEICKAGLRNEFKSLVACHAAAIPMFVKKKNGELAATGSPGRVEVHYYGDQGDGEEKCGKNPFGYAWVKKCASPMLCFIDAPKIRFIRSLEVQAACKKMLDLGYFWLFWTFTAPHDLNTDPKFQIKRFNRAKRLFKSGRWWKEFKKRWGYEHCISAKELTDDSPFSRHKSGCHWHSHDLPFFKRDTPFTQEEADQMFAELSSRWVSCLEKVGICPAEKKADAFQFAFRLDLPRIPRNTDEVANYLAKGAGCELTPGIFTKNGKIPDRVSHWELMALAFRFPELGLISRALKIMQALKGVHWLHWTPGLKALCGIKEKTDQECLEEKKSLPIHTFDPPVWRKVDKFKQEKNLMDVVLDDLKNCDFSVAPEDLDVETFDLAANAFVYESAVIFAGYDPVNPQVKLEDAVKKPPV